MGRDFGVEEDVDGGRIAGRNRHAMSAYVREESAGGELLSHDKRGAAVDRHQRAEQLGGSPVEGAEVVDPVTCRDGEAFGGRIDIAELFAIIEHDALGSRARTGSE